MKYVFIETLNEDLEAVFDMLANMDSREVITRKLTSVSSIVGAKLPFWHLLKLRKRLRKLGAAMYL